MRTAKTRPDLRWGGGGGVFFYIFGKTNYYFRYVFNTLVSSFGKLGLDTD